MADTDLSPAITDWVVEIVSSYVSNNSVPAAELPSLVDSVYASLKKISGEPEEAAKQPPVPAVPIRKSVADDHIICLEDGKSFKSLKRHLQTVYGMSPDQYRDKWGLGRDYPMVAPAYARARSALAKGMGLGANRRRPEAEDLEAAPEVEAPSMESALAEPAPAEAAELEAATLPAPKKRGRKPKAAE